VPLRQIRDDSRPISDVPLILANPQPLGARTHRPMGRMDTRSLHATLPALIDHCSSLNIGRDQRRKDGREGWVCSPARQGREFNSKIGGGNPPPSERAGINLLPQFKP